MKLRIVKDRRTDIALPWLVHTAKGSTLATLASWYDAMMYVACVRFIGWVECPNCHARLFL